MKKIFKWIGIVLLVLIIFIIAAPFLFKGKIIATVKEETNKSLNAKVDFGDFDLTLISSFPDFKFTLNNLYVAGVDSFAGDTLLVVKQLALSVNLMSVIKGSQYKINAITLDQPHILAKVLKSGKANWDIAKPSPTPQTPEQKSASAPFKMSLKKFEIRNANIAYIDEQMGFETSLKNLNHELSGDFTQDNFVLKILTTIDEFTMAYGGIKYLNKVKTSIKIDMDADMPNFKFTFKDNEFQLNELYLGLDGWFAMPKEDMDMELKFSAKKTEFKNILSLIPAVYAKDFETVKTSGKLALDAAVKGTYNDKKMPAFNAKLIVENAMFQYPSLPKAVNNINVDIKVDNKTGVPDNTVIDINKFHVEMAGNPVDVRMHVSNPVSDANIDGTIKGKINLASVKDIVPLDKGDDLNGLITADVILKGKMSSIEKKQYDQFNAAGQLNIADMNYKTKSIAYVVALKKMGLNFTPQYVELTDFDSKIGKSDLQAKGKIENFLQYIFKDDLIKGNFNVASSLLDLNELMGPEDTTKAAATADTAAMSVVAVPANIDFVLSSNFKKVLYTNMDMTNMSGSVIVRNSRVSMTDLKMNMLDGSMITNGSYDTKNIKKPVVDFDLNISDFDLPKTYKTFNTIEKLAPVAKYCTGKFSTNIKFVSDLDNKMSPVLSTLAGEGKLLTKNVVISGFAPIVKLAEATKMEKYKTMTLNNTNISFKFKDGRVNIDPFDVKLGNSNVNISGSNGFDQTIDYTMNIEVPSSEMGGTASAVNGLLGQMGGGSMGDKIKLNALIGGTVTKPTIKLGFGGSSGKSATDALKDKAKEELDKKKKELEGQAKAEIDKAKAEAERLKKEAEDRAKAEAEKAKKEAEDKLKNEAKDKLKGLFGKPK